MLSSSAAATSTECQSPSVQRRKDARHKTSATVITRLSRTHSRSSVSRSTSTAAPLRQRTTSLQVISSASSMTTESSSRRSRSSITTLRLTSSLPTAISWVHALIAAILMLTATSVRSVAATSALWSSSIRTLLSQVQSLRFARPRTGICLLTSIRTGSRSGFSKVIRNGVRMFTVSVSLGSTWIFSLVP